MLRVLRGAFFCYNKLMLSIIIFLLGLAVGSFLNCFIYRLEENKSFLQGRSFCPFCRHKLSWPDLIPVLSFLFLKGKCRYCHKKISWQYPLVEIFTGLIFFLIFNFQLPIFNFIIAPFLIIIFVYDLKHFLIPDKIIYPAIIITALFNFQIINLLSALAAAGFFLAIVLVSGGRWMGVGDVKLGFLMGLLLGFPNILVSLFLAFMMGAIIGIGLILFGKKTMRSEVPFGPFLVGGTFITLFWGQQLINWYLSFYV